MKSGFRFILSDSHKAMTIDNKQVRQFLYLTNLCGVSPCVKMKESKVQGFSDEQVTAPGLLFKEITVL